MKLITNLYQQNMSSMSILRYLSTNNYFSTAIPLWNLPLQTTIRLLMETTPTVQARMLSHVRAKEYVQKHLLFWHAIRFGHTIALTNIGWKTYLFHSKNSCQQIKLINPCTNGTRHQIRSALGTVDSECTEMERLVLRRKTWQIFTSNVKSCSIRWQSWSAQPFHFSDIRRNICILTVYCMVLCVNFKLHGSIHQYAVFK